MVFRFCQIIQIPAMLTNAIFDASAWMIGGCHPNVVGRPREAVLSTGLSLLRKCLFFHEYE